MHQGCTQNTFQRPHEPTVHTFQQRLIGGFTDQGSACFKVKKERGRHSGLLPNQLDQLRFAIAHIPSSRVGRAEINTQDVALYRHDNSQT